METEVRRGPGRPPLRQTVETTNASPADVRPPIRERKRKGSSVIDPFHIDMSKIPAGMSYEWKRHTTSGMEDPAYMMGLQENGWEPVDVSRHPEFMPSTYRGPIMRHGMILMERPVELTAEARAEDDMAARQQVRDKQAQLGDAPKNTLERKVLSVNKSYEPMDIPE